MNYGAAHGERGKPCAGTACARRFPPGRGSGYLPIFIRQTEGDVNSRARIAGIFLRKGKSDKNSGTAGSPYGTKRSSRGHGAYIQIHNAVYTITHTHMCIHNSSYTLPHTGRGEKRAGAPALSGSGFSFPSAWRRRRSRCSGRPGRSRRRRRRSCSCCCARDS